MVADSTDNLGFETVLVRKSTVEAELLDSSHLLLSMCSMTDLP